MVFGYTVWFLWRRHNQMVFASDEAKLEALLLMIHRIVQENLIVQDARLSLLFNRATPENITWLPPPPKTGWVKLNTDGASCRRNSKATAGGLLRDDTGSWIRGFTHNLGFCSSRDAELWGILDGLNLAWNLGFKKIEVEMDSKFIIEELSSEAFPLHDHNGDSLMAAILDTTRRSWSIKFVFIPREDVMGVSWPRGS